MESNAEFQPLDIVVVGAGIGGFASAIACRRAGHNVRIYERSSLNNELGAAIHVCPNASRGLLAWGLDPVESRFVQAKKSYRAHSDSLVRFHETDEGYITEKYGAPWYFAHRVDLHMGLKKLATSDDGEGNPARVILKKEVTGYVCYRYSSGILPILYRSRPEFVCGRGSHIILDRIQRLAQSPSPMAPQRQVT